eukprot:GHVQ01004546.1.p1 GENE.GHVQ01004546.1~~GHVQ01004546.1.p1  ORF type:complete len:218 (+),score=28.82 GHVQ01004546.1:535-1188(+)
MSKQRPIVVFVLGGPGAGKGTQCERIQKTFGFVHVSAGDCLREERSTPGSEYGEMIDEYIKEGKIVPVEVTVMLLMKKMRNNGWYGGKFLIDGFPRNEDNLQGWFQTMGLEGKGSDEEKDAAKQAEDKSISDVRMCLFFECTEKEMEDRLLKRGENSGRTDDNIESIRKRFRTFTNETIPIVQNFKQQGKLKSVNAMRTIDEIWDDVQKAFHEFKCD